MWQKCGLFPALASVKQGVCVVLLCFALVGISSPVLAVEYSQTIAILKRASLDYFLSVLCKSLS